MNNNFPELINEKEAARLLNHSIAKLQRDRWAGMGMPFIKIGKLVRYDKAELLGLFNELCKLS